MNQDQILSLLRWVFATGGTLLASHGVGTAATWEAVAGGVLALVPVIWSMFVHKTDSTGA